MPCTLFNVVALVIMAIKRKSVLKTLAVNGRKTVEVVQQLFEMFLHAAAVFAALEILYVALMCGAIYMVIKAFSR